MGAQVWAHRSTNLVHHGYPSLWVQGRVMALGRVNHMFTSRVNIKLIDPDERSPQHLVMDDLTPYQNRFRAVLQHLELPNRTAFAKKLGVDNPKQMAGNWFNRGGRVPDTYRNQLKQLGISIDWLNDGVGKMTAEPGALSLSQLAREQRAIVAAAVRLAAYVKDVALDPIPDEVYPDLLVEAMQVVSARGVDSIEGGAQLAEAAREVAAAMRAR